MSGRDELKTLLSFLRDGDSLVITRIDRLARSVKDLEEIVEQLNNKGVNLVATEQPIDTSTSVGKCFLQMLSVFVEFETNLRKALNWCDIANMLRVQNERMEISYFPTTREYTQQYGVSKNVLESLDKEITIMHPGPINRGVEITSEVADSDQAIILNQVENGVAIRMAVMYLLASKIKQ